MSSENAAKILIVEDSRSVRDEIKRTLKAADMKLEFYEAENGLDGFKILMESPVDLVLCDLVMPQMDGVKFLKMKASRPELEDIPVIMLTAVGETSQKIRLLSQGAGDYVVKPFHPGELVARAAVHLKIKLLQDELRQKNALLTKLSTTDGLTRIYNRRHFLERAQAEVERSKRSSALLSLFLFDVDHFKSINDTKGHLVGDQILQLLCAAIKKKLRKYDTFGRYGGDEFTILFPQTGMEEALAIANRLEEEVKSLQIPEIPDLILTISGGVAEMKEEYQDLEDLIRAADKALYEAKLKGRGRVSAAE